MDVTYGRRNPIIFEYEGHASCICLHSLKESPKNVAKDDWSEYCNWKAKTAKFLWDKREVTSLV